MAAGLARGCWFWLPPVIWPENAADVQAWIDRALGAGAARFVVNAPWQMSFFPPSTSLTVWAGPFCNLSNAAALQIVKNLGCVGAVVSPELSESDFSLLARQRPLPLGVVTAGAWPLALARSAPVDIAPDHPFVSPRKESAWVVRNDFCFWVYPNWHLDLLDREKLLKKMGYSLFIRIHEPLPETVGLKKRPGEWNWRTRLV